MEISFPIVESANLPTFTQAVRIFSLKAALGRATMKGSFTYDADLMETAKAIENYILHGKESSK